MMYRKPQPPDDPRHDGSRSFLFPPGEAPGTGPPGSAPATSGAAWPQDWDDLVIHTGEARGIADTAVHALQPGAPTWEAARRGREFEPEAWSPDGAPD